MTHRGAEEFKRVLEVSLLGQAHEAMAALPHLRRESRGVLVHVTSTLARRAFPLQSAYAAAKRGTEDSRRRCGSSCDMTGCRSGSPT